MASLRRGLVDKVKKAAAKVAAKAGTRGARAIVETTTAAVKTVDKIQSKLGRGSRKASTPAPEPVAAAVAPVETLEPRAKRATAKRPAEVEPAAMRESGRKTTPVTAAAAKRSKAPAPKKEFKAKRGQKHLHTGR